MNKILELAQLKLKEIETEIAQLTYHSNANNFDNIGILYAKYFLVDTISDIAEDIEEITYAI